MGLAPESSVAKLGCIILIRWGLPDARLLGFTPLSGRPVPSLSFLNGGLSSLRASWLRVRAVPVFGVGHPLAWLGSQIRVWCTRSLKLKPSQHLLSHRWVIRYPVGCNSGPLLETGFTGVGVTNVVGRSVHRRYISGWQLWPLLWLYIKMNIMRAFSERGNARITGKGQALAWRSGGSRDCSGAPIQFHCEHTFLRRSAETYHVSQVRFCWLLGPGNGRRDGLIIWVDLILTVSPLLCVGWLRLTR